MKLPAFIIVTVAAASAGCWQSPLKKDNDNSDNSPSVNYAEEARRSSPTPSPSNASETNMNTNSTSGTSGTEGFAGNLPNGFVAPADDVGKLLLKEYGSVFVTRATAPTKVIFRDEADVSAFQSGLSTTTEQIGGHSITLQSAAMDALLKAVAEAKGQGLSISPRGADSAKRTYNETVSLWNSRVEPALKHWVGNGKLSGSEAARIRSLSTFEQVSEVLNLEERGLYFAKDLSKSIIYSVAPPGTSQHLSMLALDVKEFDNAKVRSILANHGWFRTVASDLPHFTYIGAKESELPNLGLKKTTSAGQDFWTPDIQ